MQIVIKLSDKIYDTILNDEMPTNEQMTVIVQRIYEGTPLPIGHGRLIDADKYKREYVDWMDSCYGHTCSKEWKETIGDAPTIIEADNTKSEFEESTEDVEEYDREVYCDEELCSIYYTKCADCPAYKAESEVEK